MTGTITPITEILKPDDLIVVTGAGGFIGGALVADLRRQGFRRIRAVDIKSFDRWYQRFDDVENARMDLRSLQACRDACAGAVAIYNLAADMGGMGFIEVHKADCMLSVLINTNMLVAARDAGAKRFLFSSSACVYAADKQLETEVSLAEGDAYPAMPEDGYGWEKLFSERMCRHFREDFGLETRIVRYHNVYGPLGTFDGGREKAPAALCRKVIQAKLDGQRDLEIWGDGEQTRSFMYIDDCVLGTNAMMASDFVEPINLGSAEMVSINQLVDIIEGVAGITMNRHYKLDAPKGVRGRNSDNSLITKVLGWEPGTPLKDGIAKTYAWIHGQMTGAGDDTLYRREEWLLPPLGAVETSFENRRDAA